MISQTIRWTMIFAALMLIIPPGKCFSAWNTGGKGRTNGPTIHSTYFLTPNNQPFPIHAQTFVGTFTSGICVINAAYDTGIEQFKTGDYFDLDAFQLKSIVGLGYNCVTIYYTYRQVVSETFQLFSDGINYTATNPAITEVNIL